MRMKVQHDTSMVVRKPSRDTSTTRPCSASLGEKAMECTRKSSLPQTLATRSNTASIWPDSRESSGIRIGASSSRASGSTYFLALSLRYVTASSAPNARKALAHPHAIDCSLAMPTTRPRLPSSSLAFTTGLMKHPLARVCLSLDAAVCEFTAGPPLKWERHDFRSNFFRPAPRFEHDCDVVSPTYD